MCLENWRGVDKIVGISVLSNVIFSDDRNILYLCCPISWYIATYTPEHLKCG